MANEVLRDGDRVSLPVPTGSKAGDPVRVGSLNGVCATDRARTDVAPTNPDGTLNSSYNPGGGNVTGSASVWLVGAHDLAVTGAVANIGDPVYIDSANALSTTAEGNALFGHALATKTADPALIPVRLTQRPASS